MEALAAAAPALSIVNALTDEEHPCQALADCMTLQERCGPLAGRTVAFVRAKEAFEEDLYLVSVGGGERRAEPGRHQCVAA